MKENADLQSRVFSLEQELVRMRGEITEKNAHISVIRETESRVYLLFPKIIFRLRISSQIFPE